MPITDVYAIQFFNEHIVPTANVGLKYYRKCKALIAAYNANGYGSVILNDGTAFGEAGSNLGNSALTGNDVINMVNRAIEFVAEWEGGGSAKLNTVQKIGSDT